MNKKKIDKFDYNVVTSANTSGSSDLFSAAVNIVIPVKDWLLLAGALATPVVIFIIYKLVTKK